MRRNAQLRRDTKRQSHRTDSRCSFIQAGRQRKILIYTDKGSTAKEQCKVHHQNCRSGLDGAAIDSASEKLSALTPAEGRSSIGNQDRQRRCFHAARRRTRRTADEHQKDHHALRRTGHRGQRYCVEARGPRCDRLEQSCLNPLSKGKGIKVYEEEQQRRKDDQCECRDKDHLALHPVAVKPPLVFADIVPCQKSDAADHDQQHNRDIDSRTAGVTGKGRIEIVFCPKNVKSGVAKSRYGMKHRHPDAAPSIVPAERRQHGKRPQQFNQKRPSQDKACKTDNPAYLWC